MGTITFNNHNVAFVLKDKLLLKKFLSSVFAQESVDFKSISYIFCTDGFLLKLNQQYLNHDTLTDILTFNLSVVELPIFSEIYISIERVTENAESAKTTFLNELHRVMIHGILHLCGYNDHTKKEKKSMRTKEDFYLKQLK
ncbi:MAG: rRNA maturation RNase YbeY [Ginsengibacter sp.]